MLPSERRSSGKYSLSERGLQHVLDAGKSCRCLYLLMNMQLVAALYVQGNLHGDVKLPKQLVRSYHLAKLAIFLFLKKKEGKIYLEAL